MAELAGFPATACGDALRRIAAVREARRRRSRIAVVAALAAVPCTATSIARPPPLLLWNASASIPEGLYLIVPGDKVHRGDSVIASLREPFRSFAARRGYLPSGVPLVKRVAAVAGDRICARRATVSIDGRPAAVLKSSDALGRALTGFKGCSDLRAGEYLLLGDSAWSFDGRYFGATRSSDIIGKAVLIWRG